jgi:CubicO group peptidase (beta-lactamase class C family)
MIKKLLKWIGIIILTIVVGFCVYAFATGKTYVFKALVYNYVNIDDLDLFDHSAVAVGEPKEWPLSANYNKKLMSDVLFQRLDSLRTVAFVVIKNDSLVYEKYWENYSDSILSNSFSMAKSIIGILVGMAIEEGKIKSLDQKVGDFIPEFKTGTRAQLTLRHLITMSADLNWDEGYASLISPTTESYYGTDLLKLVTNVEVVNEPGKVLNYQSACTQLLGIAVQNATGKKISQYASEKLWKPLNAVHNAEWSLDHEDGLEKMYCCFYSNARDFARIGSLFLHEGNWHGKQLLDSSFVKESITPAPILDRGQPNKIYGYQWWIDEYDGVKIYYCRGILGQYIVVIPSENIVFVRLGHMRGEKLSDGSLTDMPIYVKEVLQWTK